MEIWLTLFGLLTVVVSIFLILLILVQRGRGGGLTGALGGMGGQSAFGSKAGDVFTRITIVTATIWILISTLMIAFFNRPPREMDDSAQGAAVGSVGGGAEADDEAPGELGGTPDQEGAQGGVAADSATSSESSDTTPPVSNQDQENESQQNQLDQSTDQQEDAGDGDGRQ